MFVAADPPTPSQPWWLYLIGVLGTILVAYLTARGPAWVEKIKARSHKQVEPTPAERVNSTDAVLREWLKAALKERDKALREVERLNLRIDRLERELYRLGWDGRSA